MCLWVHPGKYYPRDRQTQSSCSSFELSIAVITVTGIDIVEKFVGFGRLYHNCSHSTRCFWGCIRTHCLGLSRQLPENQLILGSVCDRLHCIAAVVEFIRWLCLGMSGSLFLRGVGVSSDGGMRLLQQEEVVFWGQKREGRRCFGWILFGLVPF